MDLVVTVDRFPEPGETITGREFATYLRGKGGNQAVALGREGADVLMIGKLGNDLFGEQYMVILKEDGVILYGVKVEEGVSSGIAVIEADSTGENHIVIVREPMIKSTEISPQEIGILWRNEIFFVLVRDTHRYCIVCC